MKKEAIQAEITEPSMIFRIGRTYKPGMNAQELYDVTRGYWKLNIEKANKAKYGFAGVEGIIKEVYEIDQWVAGGSTESTFDTATLVEGRHEFIGRRASEDIRQKYMDKSVKHHFAWGNQNPIAYVNIDE